MSEDFLHLRMKLFSDGGPLFGHLTAIQNSSARTSRAVQLMHLGLLVETGHLALHGGEPKGAAKESPSVASTPTHVAKPEPVAVDFAADDLAATFGLSTP